ncbi:RHS repeat-associated core domain-containing protein, partial [Streptomyces albidoflavus]
LYHFAARYYDPNIGRFTSTDPSGQEKNPYLYAEGDPVNPSGLAWYSPIASAAKSLIRGEAAPAFFVACYTYNSLADDGPEDGTLKEEAGDQWECANPFPSFLRS